MGGTQSNYAQQLKYVKQEWELLSEQEGVVIVRNRVNDKEAQIINIIHDSRRRMEKELQIYHYRYTQDNALVSVYAVDSLKLENQPSLCGNFSTLAVVVQHIPYRLSDVGLLNFQEGLYVLSESLRGFDDLYGKVGKFEITDKMVGFNTSGRVKVWFNENFAQNHPPQQKPVLQIVAADPYVHTLQKRQMEMIEAVSKLINTKVKGGFPGQLLEIINRQKSLIQAYQQIEKFCINHNIHFPDCIDFTIRNSNQENINLIQTKELELTVQRPRPNTIPSRIDLQNKFNESEVRTINRFTNYYPLKRYDSQTLMFADNVQSQIQSPRTLNKTPVFPPIIFTYQANHPH